jgi:NAD(P)-dependent dehydrogenase (short-subunit alcohol dehydrogenase family)
MKILLSGGTNGIGLEFVKKYSITHDLTVICRDNAKADYLVENFSIHTLVCDLSDHEQVKDLIDDLQDHFDIFINNAGTAASRKIVTCKNKRVNRCQMVNLITPYIIITHLLENSLVDKVISMNSMTHWTGKFPYIGELYSESYSNSKLALMSLHTYWSQNYPNVTFVSLNPGYVDTGIWHPNAWGESIHKYIRYLFSLMPHEPLYLFEYAFEYSSRHPIYISTNSESDVFQYLSRHISTKFMLCNDFFGNMIYQTGKPEVIQPSSYSQLQHTIDSVCRFCVQFI